MDERLNFDAVVCGGGLVGASLALALAQLQLSVALIEAVPFGAVQQPSFDERTTALSNGSRRVFEALKMICIGAHVPANAWQMAETTGEWTLVGCTVAPAFEFAKFELAPKGWEP